VEAAPPSGWMSGWMLRTYPPGKPDGVSGRLLLIQENYGQRRYGPPGGRDEAGENPQQAVLREVREETGLAVRVQRLIGMSYVEKPGHVGDMRRGWAKSWPNGARHGPITGAQSACARCR
jgi:ADP-ribose pyrophosphatase YjhB (NUDIX family)